MADGIMIEVVRHAAGLRAAYRLFRRRIGVCHVEDAHSFAVTACEENADWIPRLLLAKAGGRTAGAQLGGLVPAVGMISLPYTAVAASFEGQGVYRALKETMLGDLREIARSRGLVPPLGNVSEEVAGSAQYRRKVEGGIATVLPLVYRQPAVQGLAEMPLALTFEPFVTPAPSFTVEECLRIVAALYRGLYCIPRPESDPTFQRIAAESAGAASRATRDPQE